MSMYSNQLQPALQNLLQRVVLPYAQRIYQNPERSAISVTSCLADFGSCSDCQQGGLLQLSPCWYIVPAARPAAVHT